MKNIEQNTPAAPSTQPVFVPEHLRDRVATETVVEFVTRGDTPREGRTSTWVPETELSRPLRRYVTDRGPQLRPAMESAPNEKEKARLTIQLAAFNAHHALETPIAVEAILKYAVEDILTGRYTHPVGQSITRMVLAWREEYLGGTMPTLPGKARSCWYQGAKRVLKAMIARYERDHSVKVPEPTTYSSRNTLQRTVFAAGIGEIGTGRPVGQPVLHSDPLAWADEIDPIFVAQQDEATRYDFLVEASRSFTRREEQADTPYAQDYELGEEFTRSTDQVLKSAGISEGILDPYSSAQMEMQAEDLLTTVSRMEEEIEQVSARISEIFAKRDAAKSASTVRTPEARAERDALWAAYNEVKGELDELFALRKDLGGKLPDLKRAVDSMSRQAEAADEIQLDQFVLTYAGESIGPIASVMTEDRVREDEDLYVGFRDGRKAIYPAHINSRANVLLRARRAENARLRQEHQERLEAHIRQQAAVLEGEGVTPSTAQLLATMSAKRDLALPKLHPEVLFPCMLEAMAEERAANGWTNADQRFAHTRLAREKARAQTVHAAVA